MLPSLECQTAITPGIAQAGGLYSGRGVAKTMNTDEVKNYILAAALVLTGMFLIAIALTS
jgi:hypothetical protein